MMSHVILFFCLLYFKDANCLRSVIPTSKITFSRTSSTGRERAAVRAKNQLHIVPPKMEGTAHGSSLELLIVSTVRYVLYFAPLAILNTAMNQIRLLLKFHQNFEKVIVVSEISKQLDEVRLHGVNDNHNNDAVIFIHGGGFSICDSSDLMIAEKLLPLLGDNPPSFYSILYDTKIGAPDEPTYLAIQSEVYETFQKIIMSGKNILCVIGDSAGGALALNLMLRLQKNDEINRYKKIDEEIKCNRDLEKIDCTNPKNNLNHPITNDKKGEITGKIGGLCLISPWVNFFSIKSCHTKNEQFDILDRTWVSKSKRQYFGNEIYKIGENYSKQSLASEITRKFIKNGIKVVVFDMDQCIVAMHSMGRLRRSEFSTFAQKITEDFLIFAKILHFSGVKLAVGTHSDSIEYNKYYKSETDFIIGDELVDQLLSTVIPELQQHFKIIAYNPRLQNDNNRENAHKKLHIREISSFYDVTQEECVLFDDDDGNVSDTDGLFNTFKVNEKHSYLRTVKKVEAVGKLEKLKKVEITMEKYSKMAKLTYFNTTRITFNMRKKISIKMLMMRQME